MMPTSTNIDIKKTGLVGMYTKVYLDIHIIAFHVDNMNFEDDVGREIHPLQILVPLPWVRTLSEEEFKKFYSILLKLLDNKSKKFFITDPSVHNTIDVSSNKIWFVTNKDGTTPNENLLSQLTINKVLDRATFFEKKEGLDEIENDYKREKLKQKLLKQGFKALNKEQISKMTDFFANKILSLNNTNAEAILLTINFNDKDWTTWLSNNKPTIFRLLKNMYPRKLDEREADDLAETIYPSAIALSTHTFKKKAESLLIRMYNKFCSSSAGKERKLPKCDYVTTDHWNVHHRFRFWENVYSTHAADREFSIDEEKIHHQFQRWKNDPYTSSPEGDLKVKADENGIHHKLLRHKNTQLVKKTDAYHRFRRWKNKNQTFWNYIGDKFKFKK